MFETALVVYLIGLGILSGIFGVIDEYYNPEDPAIFSALVAISWPVWAALFVLGIGLSLLTIPFYLTRAIYRGGKCLIGSRLQ